MIEADYTKWSNEKNEIENFDKLSEEVKKGIYKAEQELTDNEEVDLTSVTLSDDLEIEELEFDWLGFDIECVNAGKRLVEGEIVVVEDGEDIDYYDIGYESVLRAGSEEMNYIVTTFLEPYVKSSNITVR